MIDVLVIGARGRMGTLVSTTVAAEPDMRLVGLVDPAFRDGERAAAPTFSDLDAALREISPTVAVEFSTPASVYENCRRTLAAGVNTVVGATGLTDEQTSELEQLAAARGAGLFIAPNFALGAVLVMRFAAEAARYYGRAEIVELHHEKKVDAPSGTALRTARLMRAERVRRSYPPAKAPVSRTAGRGHPGAQCPLARSRRSPRGPLRRHGRAADASPRFSFARVLHARRPSGDPQDGPSLRHRDRLGTPA